MIYGSWVIGSLGQYFGLYHVYRLEEDDSLLQEGGVTLSFSFPFSFLPLRPERKHNNKAPPPYSSRGFYRFTFSTDMSIFLPAPLLDIKTLKQDRLRLA